MKKILWIVVLFGLELFPQGKILSKENADQLFGPVLMSKEIPTETLKMYTNQSYNVIMFKLINNDLYILDNNRNALLPFGVTINSKEIFSMYSIAIVTNFMCARFALIPVLMTASRQHGVLDNNRVLPGFILVHPGISCISIWILITNIKI